MSRILRRSSASADRALLKSLQEYKRKTLNVLLWGSASIAIILLGIVSILRFTAPALVVQQDFQFLIISCLVTLIGILVIALLEKYITSEVASVLFILLLIIALFLGETPQELTFGRSQIFLFLPVIFASVLLRSWAGWLVTALSCAFSIIVPLYMHLGTPEYASVLLLILVTWLIQRSTSNLEHAMIQAQKNGQSLLESQDRYRQFAEASSYAIIVTDLERNIIDCNGAAVKMYGTASKQDLIGMKGTPLVHPDENVNLSEFKAQLLQKGSCFAPEFKILRRDGSIIISEFLGVMISDWEGKPSSIVFMLQDITERKQVKMALHESEEKFSKAFQLSPMPMSISKADGRFVEINQAFVKLYGYQPEEVIDRTPSELGILINPEKFLQSDQILREQGRLQDYKMDVRSRSGEIAHGIFFAEPLQMEDRLLVLTVMNNITERRRMEDSLRESEENYRRLIDTLPNGAIVSQDRKIQLINPTGAKILGVETPETLLGTPMLDFVPPDNREFVQTKTQAYMTPGLNAEPSDGKLVRIDGTTFDAEVISLPIKFKGKDSMITMFADITERKRAEAALKKNERNFRNLTENTAEGILIVLPDGRPVYANPKACEIFQYSPEEVLQTSLIDLADPTAYSLLQQRLQDRFVGRPVPTTYETIYQRKDGTSFPVEVTATRTVWQDQTCELVLFHDITERKRAQEALELQDRRIQEVSRQLVKVQEDEKHFLATELHDDLGQSLTSLKLMLELATGKHATHKQQEVMGNARELLAELMDKVRNLSLDLRPAMLDDFGLFATLRWLFERFHTQTGISIKCNYNLDSNQRFPPPVEIGAFRIIQEALTNIARHAAVQEAQVNIEIGKGLSIEIADQGTGFNFAHDINKLASSGGLSGMQERARLLGGQVQIYSKKDAGTRVVAKIPLVGGTI